jgi:hypothetical protein
MKNIFKKSGIFLLFTIANADPIFSEKNGFTWKHFSVRSILMEKKITFQIFHKEEESLLAFSHQIPSYTTQEGKKWILWKIFFGNKSWIAFFEQKKKHIFFALQESFLENTSQRIESLIKKKIRILGLEKPQPIFEIIKPFKRSEDRIIKNRMNADEIGYAEKRNFYTDWDLNIKDQKEEDLIPLLFGFALIQKDVMQRYFDLQKKMFLLSLTLFPLILHTPFLWGKKTVS